MTNLFSGGEPVKRPRCYADRLRDALNRAEDEIEAAFDGLWEIHDPCCLTEIYIVRDARHVLRAIQAALDEGTEPSGENVVYLSFEGRSHG